MIRNRKQPPVVTKQSFDDNASLRKRVAELEGTCEVSNENIDRLFEKVNQLVKLSHSHRRRWGI